jgi:1-acyl-sn-glycerol-3-phosphate acyltransferase
MDVPRPSEPLYHAVALGTSAYVRFAFRLEVLARERAGLPRGALLVATHRAETDAPLLIYAAYWHMGIRRDRTKRLSFAARDDLYEPGFFAGFPPALPAVARRLLFPIAIGRYLPLVRVYPIRSARAMRLAQALRRLPPDTPLADVLADDARLPARTAGDALRGELADRLWRLVTPDDVAAPEVWSAWANEAKDDVRRLVELIRAGDPLLLFPEGRPSPDGEVGPLRRGLSLLVRRGRPQLIRPIGIAYDPFVRGRTRAFVSFGAPFPPPDRDVDDAVLAALKLAMPVTCGSVVAHALSTGEPPAAALDRAVAEAREEGRNVERDLLSRESRRARLAECIVAMRRSDPRVERLAREYETARERSGTADASAS